MRFAVVALLVLFASVAVAQDKPTEFDVKIGDRFVTTTKGTVAATSALHAGELAKALRADDVAGMQQMLADKQAMLLDKGTTLHVLEVTDNRLLSIAPFAECRIIKEGKASGKAFVFLLYFKSDAMSKEAKPAP